MGNKQWGHGFYAGKAEGIEEGKEDGHEDGYKRGAELPDMMLAEQINMLLELLHSKMGVDSRDKWVVLNAISKLNSGAMLNPNAAMHNKKLAVY